MGRTNEPIEQDADQPKLPHERDEATGAGSTGKPGQGSAGEGQARVGRRAAADLTQGQVDTDLHATPGLDAQRREAMAGAAGRKPPRDGSG